jgi:hypothetical protein
VKAFSGLKRKEIINLGLFSASLVPMILFIFVAYQRIGLPFDLEWGEGAGINQIYRMISGEQLYVAPTLDFAPLVYTPFYYWLSSILSGITKQVTMTARLISVLATFGTVGFIGWLVYRETGKRMAGWLASVTYLACFALSDGFYDLIRVDSLYVFILLLSFSLFRFRSKPTGMVAAGLAIALGFYTKQSTLIVFLPLVIFLFIKNWKTAWPVLITILLGVVLPFYWINTTSEGWFFYYILQLPQEHGYSLISVVDFWVGDLLGPLGIACGFGMYFGLSHLFRNGINEKNVVQLEKTNSGMGENKTKTSHQALSYILFAVGAIGAAWITRASNGGGANNAMSAYAAVAILFGLGFSEVNDLICDSGKERDFYYILVCGLVVIQLIGLIYNPFNFIPTNADIDANRQLVSRMEETEGPIFIPYRSHLPFLAGKDTTIHAVNLFELTGYFKGDVLPVGRELVDQLQDELCNQTYGMIILDQPIPWIEKQLGSAYQEVDNLLIMDTGRRSIQLSWQGGFEAIYIPVEAYEPEDCLKTIEQEGEG